MVDYYSAPIYNEAKVNYLGSVKGWGPSLPNPAGDLSASCLVIICISAFTLPLCYVMNN